ncbi:hypothetical protein [Petroclostridium xylanilyticum]|jgi:hypothetical protein|uniref:hypothetical protein n=1 Tax=Petroclostridium xylanilyticum TaxID=1792311 RepID=UPI000B992576|nr:hypothetical protein [Petroclostridium xylanilyticum]
MSKKNIDSLVGMNAQKAEIVVNKANSVFASQKKMFIRITSIKQGAENFIVSQTSSVENTVKSFGIYLYR